MNTSSCERLERRLERRFAADAVESDLRRNALDEPRQHFARPAFDDVCDAGGFHGLHNLGPLHRRRYLLREERTDFVRGSVKLRRNVGIHRHRRSADFNFGQMFGKAFTGRRQKARMKGPRNGQRNGSPAAAGLKKLYRFG